MTTEILECSKCGCHYVLTEFCTQSKCPICTSGMTPDWGRSSWTDIWMKSKGKF